MIQFMNTATTVRPAIDTSPVRRAIASALNDPLKAGSITAAVSATAVITRAYNTIGHHAIALTAFAVALAFTLMVPVRMARDAAKTWSLMKILMAFNYSVLGVFAVMVTAAISFVTSVSDIVWTASGAIVPLAMCVAGMYARYTEVDH